MIITTKKKDVESKAEAERKLKEKAEELEAKEKELAVINNKINGDTAIQCANKVNKKPKNRKSEDETEKAEPTKPKKKEVSKELAEARIKLSEGYLQALKELGSATTHQLRKKLELPEDWRVFNDLEVRTYALQLEKANKIIIDRSARSWIYKIKTD